MSLEAICVTLPGIGGGGRHSIFPVSFRIKAKLRLLLAALAGTGPVGDARSCFPKM